MFSGLEMLVNCDNVRTVLNTSLSVSVFRNDEFLCDVCTYGSAVT